MKPYLLDINVLIALAWPSHVHHHYAQRWFARKHAAGFRTCPLTQTGFVRLSSNPSFTPQAVSPREALALLERLTSLRDHEFWPADLPLGAAIPTEQPVLSHRQVTDLYLLGIARAHRGILATLDRGVLALGSAAARYAELLRDAPAD